MTKLLSLTAKKYASMPTKSIGMIKNILNISYNSDLNTIKYFIQFRFEYYFKFRR